jgi:CRP-like cAMP-binding protein
MQQGAIVETSLPHPLLLKLEQHTILTDADRDLLGRMLADIRTVDGRRDIIRVGKEPEFVHLMIEGWSCRYSIVDDGRRQITAFLLPGDFCDAHILMLGQMDHSIGALGRARVAFIPIDLMAEVAERPSLARALRWATLVDEAVLRAWLANMGRRNAHDRVAHLVCELHARLLSIGEGRGDSFDMPLTQEDLGDALGLTPVHINRVLRSFRERGLMTFLNRTIIIQDVEGMKREAAFDPHYLHLDQIQGS